MGSGLRKRYLALSLASIVLIITAYVTVPLMEVRGQPGAPAQSPTGAPSGESRGGGRDHGQAAPVAGEFDFRDIISKIDYENIANHVKSISSLGSRVTGYEGSYRAAEYIYSYLKDTLHISNVTVQEYEVAVPVDYGAEIEIPDLGLVIPAYTLWPNFIQTCKTPPGKPYTGKLVYVGKGELEDFNGRDVAGAIVLMDFNSGDNWLTAAKLGAKAVIFIAPKETTFTEALAKFKIVPIHFPRVYVNRSLGYKLIEYSEKHNITVKLSVDMRYEMRKARNIVAIIPGEITSESIIVAAHYDTWSIVPRLAPGADEASGIASLLELARYFSQNKPKRSIILAALSGHWQALAGAREFVEKYFFDPRVVSGEHKIWLFIGLDFSTDGYRPAILYRGYMYNYGSPSVISRWNRWLTHHILNEVIPALERQTGKSYGVGSGIYGDYGWWASISSQFMLDSEAFAAAHGISVSVRTNNVARQHWGHPLSGLEYFNIENLKPQLEVAAAIVFALANRDTIEINWLDARPAKMLLGLGGADFSGFVTVHGEVLVFNFTRGWYSRLPNAIVSLTLIGHWYSEYPFSRIITMADENGRFEVHGAWGFQTGSTYVEAYRLDKDGVYIEYAPDYGLYGIRQIPFWYLLDQASYNVSTVVFKASSLVLFDLVDPIRVTPKLFLDPRLKIGYTPHPYISHVWTSIQYSVEVYDFSTLSEFITWGVFTVGYEDVAMVFAPPRSRCMVIYRLGTDKMVLVNASEQYPEGRGFYMYEDYEYHLHLTARQFASDMYHIVDHRYNKLENIYLRNFFVELYFKKAMKSLSKADLLLRGRNYKDAYAYYILAWNEISHAYSGLMSTITDTLNVNLMYFVFLVPFIVFGEMLFLSGEGRKKAANIIALGIVLTAVYYFVAPPPKVAQNFAMSPLSIVLEMLYIFVALLFLNEIVKIFKEMRRKVIGVHFAERDLVSTAMVTFNYSIRNMRKRRLRTGLVLGTIITVAFAMVSFTSIAMIPRLQPGTVQGNPTFNGILIKYSIDSAPSNIIDPYYIDILKHLIGPNTKYSVRVWYYPISEEGKEVKTAIYTKDGRKYEVKAVLGLSPEEFNIHSDYIPVRGYPSEGLRGYTIAIPELAAKALGVDVGDEVYLGSYKLLVVGIYNSSIANLLKELDNYPFTPVDPNLVVQLATSFIQQEERLPLSWSEIVVVPYDLALDMGGYISSIAIPLDDEERIREIGSELAYLFRGPLVYLSYNGSIYTIGFLGGFGLQGWNYFMGPLIIGSLTILMTILGGIKERVREIYVYTAVGLSPTGVTMLFIAESLVYALTAAVIGYILGIVANIYLVSSNMLPPTFIVNASSFSVSVSLIVTLLASVLSAMYPAFMASKLSIPSLERRWKLPTKPRGNKWEIPLPISIPSYQEAYGLLYYIYEYLVAHKVETPESFIVEAISIDPEKAAIVSTMALKPLESGTRQNATITIRRLETENRYIFTIHLEFLHGARDVWTSVNYHVVDAIRKQILLWRSLSEDDRYNYIQKGLSVIKAEI